MTDWSIKLPTLRPIDYAGDLIVEGGALLLVILDPAQPLNYEITKAYAPNAWEYVERKPE